MSDRRGSAGSGIMNLMNSKRNPNDEAGAARRASHSDQFAKPGFIGSMWQSWTKGTSPPPKVEKQTSPTGPVGSPPKKQSIHRTGAGTMG